MSGDSEKKKAKEHKGGDSSAEKSSKTKKLKQEQAADQPASPAAAPSTEKKKQKKHEKQRQQQQQQGTQQDDTQQQPSAKKSKKQHKQDAAAVQQHADQQLQPGCDKKRKQQQPEQPQSSKKHKKQQQAAAPTEPVTVSIKVPAVSDKASKKSKSQHRQQQQAAAAGPWLVYMSAPDPSVYSKLQFKAFVPQGAAAADQGMVLLSEQEGTTLIGSTKSNINEPAAQFGGYAVGVYDKRTNTLQLAKPAGGSVVRVEALASQAGPVEVAALSHPAQQSLEQQQAVQAARQGPQDLAARRAQATRLVEAFGSTRRKRQLQQRAEGTVVVEGNAAAAELDVMMHEVQRRAQAAGDTRAEIMGRLAANRVVPAHNPLATTPEEAYPARLMFGEALLSAVNVGQMLHAAENADDADKLRSKVPAYVVSRLARIREAGSNQGERKRRARLLALLGALLRLAAGRPRLTVRPPQPAVEGGEGEEGWPARVGGLEGLAASLRIGRTQVLELLLDKFYDKRMEDGRLVYVREAKQEQLMLMHLLVVALDLEGWRMAPQQFEMLRRELKTTPADVVNRFRELGCSSTAVRIKVASEGGGPADEATATSYNITLLPSGTKTLAQSFPRPKILKKQGPR